MAQRILIDGSDYKMQNPNKRIVLRKMYLKRTLSSDVDRQMSKFEFEVTQKNPCKILKNHL